MYAIDSIAIPPVDDRYRAQKVGDGICNSVPYGASTSILIILDPYIFRYINNY